MAKTTLEQIREMVRGRTTLNAPMAELTTMRVGGPADILIHPADREDLGRVVAFLTSREVPYFVLGNGSNLVVRDSGIRGAVIQLGEGFQALERLGGDEPTVRAEAGATLRRLVRWSVDQALLGFQALAGIPGTVGGAVTMNAGAWGFEIGERVRELEVMLPTGEIEAWGREALRFDYRRLDLPPGAIVLAALLEGERGEREEAKEGAKEAYRRRRETQPTQHPSAGSVFRNPAGRSAGRLIDECGLKGVRVGDAEVSQVHGNFIVNTGMATASQVVALMGMIQERVYVKHRVKLEPEVHVVGEWEKGKLRIQE